MVLKMSQGRITDNGHRTACQQKLVVLRRVDPRTGALVKWDNSLTFEELRDGRLKSRLSYLEELAA